MFATWCFWLVKWSRALNLLHELQVSRFSWLEMLWKLFFLFFCWKLGHTNIKILRSDPRFYFDQNARGLRTLSTNTTLTGITRLCPVWGTVPRPAGGKRTLQHFSFNLFMMLRLTKWCESISFRSRVSSSQDIGNCLLSDIKPESLRDVGDVVKVSLQVKPNLL